MSVAATFLTDTFFILKQLLTNPRATNTTLDEKYEEYNIECRWLSGLYTVADTRAGGGGQGGLVF